MIISFGHARATPPKADRIWDVRDLPHNFQDPLVKARIDHITRLCLETPGDIAIGCQWGQHRAPYIAEEVARRLKTSVRHRDRTPGVARVSHALAKVLARL